MNRIDFPRFALPFDANVSRYLLTFLLLVDENYLVCGLLQKKHLKERTD